MASPAVRGKRALGGGDESHRRSWPCARAYDAAFVSSATSRSHRARA